MFRNLTPVKSYKIIIYISTTVLLIVILFTEVNSVRIRPEIDVIVTVKGERDLSMIERLTEAEQLEDLRSISGDVAEYLDTEEFREDYDYDNFQIGDILYRCYQIVIDELKVYGIFLSVSEDQILSDWFTAKHIYYIRKLVDAENLSALFTQFADRQVFYQLTDSMIESTDLLSRLLQVLVDYSPENYQELLQFSDRLYATDKFRDHLSAILADLDSKTTTPELATPEEQMEYLRKVKRSRQILIRIRDLLLANDPDVASDVDLEAWNHTIENYDREKIQPDTLPIYAHIDKPVPPHLEKYKKQMMDQHHQAVPHHIEYWEERIYELANLDMMHVIMLISHHAEPDSSVEDFTSGAYGMIEEHHEIFVSSLNDWEEFATRIIKLIAKNYGEIMEGI